METKIVWSMSKCPESYLMNSVIVVQFLKMGLNPSQPRWVTQSPLLGTQLWPWAPHLLPGLSSIKPAAANKPALHNCARPWPSKHCLLSLLT